MTNENEEPLMKGHLCTKGEYKDFNYQICMKCKPPFVAISYQAFRDLTAGANNNEKHTKEKLDH